MNRNKSSKKLSNCFKGCLYFTAGRLYRTVERLAFEAFSPLSLAPSQAFLLMSLAEMGEIGATPSDLSVAMNLDRSTVTRLMSGLEKKHIVKSITIGRYKRIELTAKGEKLMPEIKKAWRELYRLYSNSIGEDKARIINTAINQNLKKDL